LVTLKEDELVLPEGDSNLNEYIQFYVNDTLIPVEIYKGTRILEGKGILDVSGVLPSEELGRYTATIRVIQLPPHPVLEYSWEFDVLDEEPSLPGLPEGFRFVRPLPDSVITQRAYREGRLTPSRYRSGVADLRNGVCVGVLPHKIVEPGEFLEGDVFHKYHFVTLNGEPPRQGADISGATEPYRVNLYDDNGEVIASYVGPSSFKCWYVDLAPGQHEVLVEINKASGETIQYAWQFTIVPDE